MRRAGKLPANDPNRNNPTHPGCMTTRNDMESGDTILLEVKDMVAMVTMTA
jgi:hypothetical protein